MAHDRQRKRTIDPRKRCGSPRSGAVALVLLCASMVTGVSAQDVRRGELLYENHCSDCHDRNVHQRDTYRIGKVADVRAWVASWAAHQELGWNEDDIQDVTLYLARHIYLFDR